MNFSYKDIADKLPLKFYIGDSNLLTSLMFKDKNNFINFAGQSKGEKQFFLLVKDLYPQVDIEMLAKDYNTNINLILANCNMIRYYHTKYLFPNLEFVYDKSNEPEMMEYSETFNLLDSLVLPIEHPFWNTYLPPNHFSDDCTVRVSDKDITAIPNSLPSVEERFIINRSDLFFDKPPFLKEQPSGHSNDISFLNDWGVDIDQIIDDIIKDIE